MPDWKMIKAGSKWWDVYSIICIILECDLKDGEYSKIRNASMTLNKAKSTCKKKESAKS